jgi:SAM-dependent methyltransferase
MVTPLDSWSKRQGHTFSADWYFRGTQRRQEHLASLGLNLSGLRVLEVGAGIGDHTSFFLDRGCSVVTTDGRAENVEVLRTRYPSLEVTQLDLDNPEGVLDGHQFDVIYCYGLLYHLAYPAEALQFMAKRTKLLLLETAVSFDKGVSIQKAQEVPTILGSLGGTCCRPSRAWIMKNLESVMPYTYITATQPWHKDFPLDWESAPADDCVLTRAVFVASHEPVTSSTLLKTLPKKQQRH